MSNPDSNRDIMSGSATPEPKKPGIPTVFRSHMSDRLIRRLKPVLDKDCVPLARNARELLGKPVGLWYEINGGWIRWCKSEEPTWIRKYHYEIDASKLNILSLNSVREVVHFSAKYAPFSRASLKALHDDDYEVEQAVRDLPPIGESSLDLAVDDLPAPWEGPKEENVDDFVQACKMTSLRLENPAWEVLYKQYDGIEIYPYQWKLRLRLHWYYGWDCASGVIWNTKNVGLKLIGNPQRHPVLGRALKGK